MAITIPFVLTNAQAQTVATAVGGILGLGQDATIQQVHDWMWGLAKSQVMNWQDTQSHRTVAAPADLGSAT